jgi:hypothetical protein
MSKLTKADVIAEFNELKDFEPDGSTDFDRVSKIIGSRNPKIVWAVVNALRAETSSPKLSRLMAKLGG